MQTRATRPGLYQPFQKGQREETNVTRNRGGMEWAYPTCEGTPERSKREEQWEGRSAETMVYYPC